MECKHVNKFSFCASVVICASVDFTSIPFHLFKLQIARMLVTLGFKLFWTKRNLKAHILEIPGNFSLDNLRATFFIILLIHAGDAEGVLDGEKHRKLFGCISKNFQTRRNLHVPS